MSPCAPSDDIVYLFKTAIYNNTLLVHSTFHPKEVVVVTKPDTVATNITVAWKY
jgi:hypothetical protein